MSVETALRFIQYTEGLKRELRNSWLSDGRQESVAEHSWRMMVMAMTLAPQTRLDLDMEKVLKMAAIHDLAEIETGDVPTIHQTDDVARQKVLDEHTAMDMICDRFGEAGQEVALLWQEFEDLKTSEARFVRAMDRLDASIQKNQQSVDRKPGKLGYFEKTGDLCADDPFLQAFFERVKVDVDERVYQ